MLHPGRSRAPVARFCARLFFLRIWPILSTGASHSRLTGTASSWPREELTVLRTRSLYKRSLLRCRPYERTGVLLAFAVETDEPPFKPVIG